MFDNAVVPDTEITVVRLSTLRDLHALAGSALRGALLAAVRHRVSGTNAATVRHLALDSLDVLLVGLPVATAERVRVRTQVATAADRFARSRLGRRLLSMPVSRIAASPVASADLIVRDSTGRRFAVVFARRSVPFAFAEMMARMARELPDCEAVLIYDIERGITRRFTCSPLMSARCA